MDAEQVVLAAAGRTDGRRLGAIRVGLAVTEAAANRHLDPSQAALVTALATTGAPVQIAVAPAGTGKTTAMRVLGDLWRDSGGIVLGLAPSAAAARDLGRALSAEAETLAKLVTDITGGLTTPLTTAVGPSTLLLVDEAGMAATTDLAAVVTFALERGASVRLIGDDHQLTAVAAGGLPPRARPPGAGRIPGCCPPLQRTRRGRRHPRSPCRRSDGARVLHRPPTDPCRRCAGAGLPGMEG